MRITTVAAVVGAALLCSQSQALPQQIKHAKPAMDRHEPLTGWATRLSIPEEDGAGDYDKRSLTGLTLQDESGSALFFAKYSLYSAWKWLWQPVSSAVEDEVSFAANWTDKFPRFVAYGDRYVQNNSLGVPDPQRLRGFTYYNIAFWMADQKAQDNVAEWVKGSKAQRNAIVKAYNDAGIRLGVAVFGATDKPQTQGHDPIALANEIGAFVVKYGLQGVDVDYEEYNLFEQRRATSWLIPLTRQLRVALPRENGYYLSHAPVAPLFNGDVYPLGYTWVEKRIGSAVDFYNVQYYNQGAYGTCETLVRKADGFAPKTSLLELTSVWGIPMSKVVAGKPARNDDADGGDGYMTPTRFANCLKQASDAGWKAGAMWWEYRGDLQFVLQPVQKQLSV